MVKVITDCSLTAGLYLHRLWQLGLETEYYSEGVRPHLAVFYQSISTRPAFIHHTKVQEKVGERRIISKQEEFTENARWGLGAAALLGKTRLDIITSCHYLYTGCTMIDSFTTENML